MKWVDATRNSCLDLLDRDHRHGRITSYWIGDNFNFDNNAAFCN
jgi:hypothetical protein